MSFFLIQRASKWLRNVGWGKTARPRNNINIATDMNKNEHNKKKNKNSPSIKELFAFYDGRLPKKIRLKETAI